MCKDMHVCFHECIQGDQLSDSVLGVGNTCTLLEPLEVCFYYNNLTAIEPQSQDSDDLQLGLTRMYTVRARVDNVLDAPSNSPINVPSNMDSLYGEYIHL